MGGTLGQDQNNWIAKTPRLVAIAAPDANLTQQSGMKRQ